jgi:hypothetical protein
MKTINIYCDESCHLERDHQRVMVLGALWADVTSSHEIAKNLRRIKAKHFLPNHFELKWTKISPGKLGYYIDVINFFFDEPTLRFRAVVAWKDALDHCAFDQDHDTWYYKMYYQLLKHLINRSDKYRVYLDVKDTKSASKQHKLREVLCNRLRDFAQTIVERVQTVQSGEVEQVQLADLLAGALSHHNRMERSGSSEAKSTIIRLIQERSGHSLRESTPYGSDKLNILHWQPRAASHE